MRSIGLLLTLSFFLQCATYWKNRKNDFQDIVTVGAETPMYGAAVKVGPLPIGVLFQGGESEMGKKRFGPRSWTPGWAVRHLSLPTARLWCIRWGEFSFRTTNIGCQRKLARG